MKKTTLLAIIFLSMAITGYGCGPEENDKYDCRMHYRQSLLRTLNYFDFVHLTTLKPTGANTNIIRNGRPKSIYRRLNLLICLMI